MKSPHTHTFEPFVLSPGNLFSHSHTLTHSHIFQQIFLLTFPESSKSLPCHNFNHLSQSYNPEIFSSFSLKTLHSSQFSPKSSKKYRRKSSTPYLLTTPPNHPPKKSAPTTPDLGGELDSCAMSALQHFTAYTPVGDRR